VVDEIQQLQKCLKKVDASFLIVSNEVGLGLVPDNRMGRLYRDNLGRANQMLAQTADQVMLLVAGIPLQVKPNDSL
jgi:adenosylcobinamide kinase/adenosylcobinamide-phosphate guanylyltransferase